MKRVDHRATPGTIRTARDSINQRRWLGRGSRAMANPAHELINNVNGTANTTTRSELSVYRPKGTTLNTRPKLLPLTAIGRSCSFVGSAVPGGCSAAITIQATGSKKISTTAIWTIDLADILEDKGFICRPYVPLPGDHIERNDDETGQGIHHP